jgi:type I restriction enzyme M protein
VKSSILFLKKHPKALTKQLETILCDVKAKVKDEKGLDKGAKEERILELYRKETSKHDYNVLMFEMENIGYDTIGKKIDGSELMEVAHQINNFIIGNEL